MAAYTAYGLAFIWRSSFEIGGRRWFSLFDDAMVSMRYARNLAAGDGLVWNPGERVEGLTNVLWTLWMAVLHSAPVHESKLALLVQLTSLALLVANLFVVRALALRLSGGSRGAALGAVALTASYMPLNNWALQGMEVGVLALLLSAATLLGLRALDRARTPLAAFVLLGIATFARLDMAVPLLIFTGFLVAADRERRWRHLATGLGMAMLCVGLQTALRLWYYGDPLPNTYYLKMTGYPLPYRLSRGLFVTLETVWYANPLLFFAPLGLLWARRGERALWLPAAMVAGQFAYSVYVGGDAWEWWGGFNRYAVVAAPLYLVLLSSALRQAFEWAGSGRGRAAWSALGPRSRRLAWAAAVLFAAASLNALKGPRSFPEWLGLAPPLHVRDNEAQVRVGLWVRAHTPEDAVIAVRWAGTMPYFSRRPAVDLLGKSDRRVARLPMLAPSPGFQGLLDFYPGHMKWDYAYSVGRLQPDIVFYGKGSHELILPYLRDYHPVQADGGTVFLRYSP